MGDLSLALLGPPEGRQADQVVEGRIYAGKKKLMRIVLAPEKRDVEYPISSRVQTGRPLWN